MRFALLVSSSRAMCPPKDVIGIIGIRCENTKQSFTSFTSSKQRRRNPAKKDTIVIDFGGGGGGKKKSRGQNVDDDVKVVERGGGGEKHDGVTQKGSRRSTFIAVAYASCAFFAQGGGFLPNNAKAGSGGWGDCAPVCDALKDGFSAQQKMQEEMLRQSLATMNKSSDESGFGDDGSEKEDAKKKSDKVDFAQKSEREKRKKISTTRRQ